MRFRAIPIVIVLGAALLAGSPGFGAPDDPRDPIVALIAEARDARAAGDHERALVVLEQVYQLAPSASVLNNIAVTLTDLGRYADALATARRLAADPTLPPERRPAIDAQIAALAPRAERAWLVVDADPEAELRLDGAPLARAEEHAVGPGALALELVDARARTALRLTLPAPALGRRARLDLRAPALPTAYGALELEAVRAPAVTIDDRAWPRVGPGAVDRVWLAPGPHSVSIDGAPPLTVAVARGARVALSDARDGAGPGLGPIVTGLAGALAAGVGVALWVDADNARADLRAALARAGDPADGIARRAALDREAAADLYQSLGAGSLAVGGAALVSGLVWFLAGDDDGAPRLMIVPRAAARAW